MRSLTRRVMTSVLPTSRRVVRARCQDCGKDTEPMKGDRALFKQWDFYIVRDDVWMEAGMGPWDSGFLCTPCLRARLGRDLTDDDYLARPVGATNSETTLNAKPE